MSRFVNVRSRTVGNVFGRKHKNVLQAIKGIINPESGVSKELIDLNFQPN